MLHFCCTGRYRVSVDLGKIAFDGMASAEQDVGQCSAVGMRVACLAYQSEV